MAMLAIKNPLRRKKHISGSSKAVKAPSSTPKTTTTHENDSRDDDCSAIVATRTCTSQTERAYSIHAPPGLLGIIIDTTPEGPMIHSLKPTSLLLGLVTPGDLIVGLDGVDTRRMTAATFTRFMGSRSGGKRWLTLLKGDYCAPAPVNATPHV
mmetsp:Transcript_5536/g.13869  ORF Transcript_5536/g.13869 Transcript_5536/m.13869 type:complete len:153 (-) Transcript_5536:161-619(-)